MFSATVVKQLGAHGRSDLAAAILSDAGIAGRLDPRMSLEKFYDLAQDALWRGYRNEYVYKNAVANKLLLGIHSLNSSFMLTEFRVNDCKADIVILNGTSNAYEIKSGFDTLDRLGRQLKAYQLVFDRVNVITSEEQRDDVLASIPDEIGLLLLTQRQTISTVRAASSLRNGVSPAAIFDTLRQNEYLQILERQFGHVPDVPNGLLYQACRRLFCQLPSAVAHDEMLAALRARRLRKGLQEFVEAMPRSLKAASLSCGMPQADQRRFTEALKTEVSRTVL